MSLPPRFLAPVLLVAAATMFAVRGPGRALSRGDDLAPPYAGTRAFLEARNPYQDTVLKRILLETGRETEPDGQPEYNPSLYPPPTFVAMAPLSLAPWQATRVIFLLVALGLFAWHVRELGTLVDAPPWSRTFTWIITGALALAPFHTGIAMGQLAIPSVTLLVVALAISRRGYPVGGGVALALATLLKPQIAAPFILYVALRKQRATAFVAAGLVAVVSAGALGWLALHQIDWFPTLREVTREIQVGGGPADPAGPLSAQMVDLRPLLAALHVPAPLVTGFAIAGAFAVPLYVWGRRLGAEHDALLIGAIGVLTLFVTYHRFYDAAVLSVPLAWAITGGGGSPRLRLGVLLCCAVFFVPGAWAMQVFANRGMVPGALAHTALWNVVLLRHQNWALLVLMVLLLAAIRQARTQPAPTT